MSNKRIELLADNPQFFLYFARKNSKFYIFLCYSPLKLDISAKKY